MVAGAARVAGVLLGKRSGSGPAGVRGGSGNALCLQGVSAAFRIRGSETFGQPALLIVLVLVLVRVLGLAGFDYDYEDEDEDDALRVCRRFTGGLSAAGVE